jgi:hypothetical protein
MAALTPIDKMALEAFDDLTESSVQAWAKKGPFIIGFETGIESVPFVHGIRQVEKAGQSMDKRHKLWPGQAGLGGAGSGSPGPKPPPGPALGRPIRRRPDGRGLIAARRAMDSVREARNGPRLGSAGLTVRGAVNAAQARLFVRGCQRFAGNAQMQYAGARFREGNQPRLAGIGSHGRQ